ncbi:ABC transporter permease [Pontibacillus litoralis]|uniref:ABC transporter permease n=1 Tax=Pontibacillus litoralis JSM 072002 TaxID=1385512 RepID=A0A0A5G6T4_9BACI|nr:ABC transporter permease [Pontibacillus litoralis]KGX86878.1 ABC transporter permease [Pontibacillus litoralis JSM 072002]
MALALFSAFESGVIYAIMALGVYLSFRVLDFPDLTVDGSFVTGAAVAAVMILQGYNPFLASTVALLAGFVAGCLTGILHTKGGINPLLSGILMMIALYSINLRIMGKSNIPLLNQQTALDQVEAVWSNVAVLSSWGVVIFMLLVTLSFKLLLDWFLKTEVGLAVRATGNNPKMIRSFAAHTDWLIILGLGVSNAFVAFSGAFIAQLSSFADVGMGIGMIIIGLASVIIGEALFGSKTIGRTTLAVIGGAIVYRIVVSIALRIEFLDAGDMKLITAIIVIIALIVPKVMDDHKVRKMKKKRNAQRLANLQSLSEEKEEHHASS